MKAGAKTFIVPELLEAKGVWSAARLSPVVTASDIRKWAIATAWPETPSAVYWDETYAAGTRWGGVIAPPDFNPFAWPVHRPKVEALPGLADYALTSLNGGQVETYGVPQRPGDIVAERNRIQEFNERQGRFGLMLYTYVETDWTNQNAEFVRRRVSTYISY
jgi:hypothetical protein